MKYLLAIKSAHKHAERRQACRDTWLPSWPHEFVFLLGNPCIMTRDVFPDTLWVNASDAFADIAPKVQAVCKYALNQNKDFLAVCDDDTYLRPERLLISGFERHDYNGFMRTDGLFYNNEIPYAQGSCFTLSARAMEIVAKSAEMRPGIIDDGAVGRALVGKVCFNHDYRFEPGPVSERLPLPSNELISTHKCLPARMHDVHKEWISAVGILAREWLGELVAGV